MVRRRDEMLLDSVPGLDMFRVLCTMQWTGVPSPPDTLALR